MENKIAVVTRYFQPRATVGTLSKEGIDQFVARVRRLFEVGAGWVDHAIIVLNGDLSSPFSEGRTEDRLLVSEAALENALAKELSANSVTIHVCENWGDNAGSATALNDGLEIASQLGYGHIMCWSQEIEFDKAHLLGAQYILEKHPGTAVVGFYRKNWIEKPFQYGIPQNTAAVWNVEMLLKIGGFAEECNGTGRKVRIDGFGEVSVAGMEDFQVFLRMISRYDIANISWGMAGFDKPLPWQTQFSDPARQQQHNTKVARQEQVMRIYCGDIFPKMGFEDLMLRIFSKCIIFN